MSRLVVTCKRCGARFSLRDNGYEDPAAGTRCPRCGSRTVERWDVAARSEPREAAA
ncbi:MAG TPA: hypothetical protein VMH50_02610 [Thermoleophilia bacterium]|nr:hypothetical protein [Thermoleophilia bacterium]